MIHHGDCLEVMAAMEPESVDAIVTDPPYGLEFMGKEWDKLGATVEHPDDGEGPWGRTRRVRFGASAVSMQEWHQRWAEAAYRVAKPSAYLLAFGGTRTVHRMTVALEDAGWIIRDMLVWAYASGFPKSKASLKPAWEPIVMARKPGPLRMLAIDSCRLPVDPHDAGRDGEATASTRYAEAGGTNIAALPGPRGGDPQGRWPANLVLTDPIFDGGVEGVVGGGDNTDRDEPETARRMVSSRPLLGSMPQAASDSLRSSRSDSGTYSRFFLIPKADRSDREPVLGGLPLQRGGSMEGGADTRTGLPVQGPPRANVHPTVKPTELMRHLVRLVTPVGGTVLDPFLGSGTTGLAAEMEGFSWIGIEKEAEYVAIAEARLNGTQRGLGLSA